MSINEVNFFVELSLSKERCSQNKFCVAECDVASKNGMVKGRSSRETRHEVGPFAKLGIPESHRRTKIGPVEVRKTRERSTGKVHCSVESTASQLIRILLGYPYSAKINRATELQLFS